MREKKATEILQTEQRLETKATGQNSQRALAWHGKGKDIVALGLVFLLFSRDLIIL